MTLIDDGAMEARCRSIIATLELPDPCTVQTLVAAIAERQQQEISLLPLPATLVGEVSGMVRHTDDGYEIYYPHQASPWWALACVSHEIGHIVCGHVPNAPAPQTSPTLAGVPAARNHGIEQALPAMAEAFAAWDGLWRCQNQGPQEREAEFLASLLTQRVHQPLNGSVVSAVLTKAPTPRPPRRSAPSRRRASRLWRGLRG